MTTPYNLSYSFGNLVPWPEYPNRVRRYYIKLKENRLYCVYNVELLLKVLFILIDWTG